MLRQIATVVLIIFLLAPGQRGYSFSLIGLKAAWQAEDIGFKASDVGGPVPLGEGYRWNVPVITYAFDQSFLKYFGQSGIESVEKALSILDGLPNARTIQSNIMSFPQDTKRINYVAAALDLQDVGTHGLANVLNFVGIGAGERWVWTMRAHRNRDNTDFYDITSYNYDPITLAKTAYVNGQLYTYNAIKYQVNPDAFEAFDIPLVPGLPQYTSIAYYSDYPPFIYTQASFSSQPGTFFTQLTRDEAGAWSYLHSQTNYAYEVLPPGSITGASGVGSLGSGDSPWKSPGFLDSVGDTTEWSVPGATIIIGTGGGGTAGATNGPVVTDSALTAGVRPGIEKMTFRRINYDSLVGLIPDLLLVDSNDRVLANGTLRSRLIRRLVTVPDIIFTAADIGTSDDPIAAYIARTVNNYRNTTTEFPRFQPLPNQSIQGPGVVVPPFVVTYQKLLPDLFHIGDGPESDGLRRFAWGYFDGTTNTPTVFPNGQSIRNLESQVLGSN